MTPFPSSPFASVLDQVREGERHPAPSILELAYAHPSGIAQHVLDAHEKARAEMGRKRAQVTAEITFQPSVGAFELVTATHEMRDILLALGPGAKITITL